MSNQISNTKRIAKNTLMLYFRQILILLVSLYTVRVVLNTLGAEDYGIYNVVAGVVTMFSFLSGAMATASQRYFSFDMGKNDFEHLKTTFSVTFQIYILIALIVLFFAETLGLWFVNAKLVIPQERMIAANWIYQAAIISFLFTLITTPYMALIIAHEDMNIYALVSIVEVLLKLGIVFLLRIFSFDKLIVYGILLAIITMINTSLYRGFCLKKYTESRFQFVKNRELFTDIVCYSGWNLFGASATVVKNQFVNILLNIFFGPLVNAARGIASQVYGGVVSFAQNFALSMQPQIIKLYSSSKEDECLQLVYTGCKFEFILMWIFTLPLCFEMPFVLKIWLDNVPPFTIGFTILILIDGLFDSIIHPIMTLARATGKIKMYQGISGIILMLNFPMSYIFLLLGYSPYCVYIVSIVNMIILQISRFLIVSRISTFSIKKMCKLVLIPGVWIIFISSFCTFFVWRMIKNQIFNFFSVVLISVIVTSVSFFFIGLSKQERVFVLEKINNLTKRINK